MATEPTLGLGLRFRRHVAGWVMDSVPTPPPGELEALEARADAAERLAVAHINLIDQPAGGEGPSFVYLADQRSQAEDAWRAITEVTA